VRYRALPPVRADLYTSHEIEMAMDRIRFFMPRNREDATSEYSFVTDANISWGLVQEALMRLLFDDQVKRRKEGRGHVYWASRRMAPSPAVPPALPERLHHFFHPTLPNWTFPPSS
jgi:hypothetical protein